MEYVIVNQASMEMLEKEVSAMLRQGWVCQGGVCVYNDFFYLADLQAAAPGQEQQIIDDCDRKLRALYSRNDELRKELIAQQEANRQMKELVDLGEDDRLRTIQQLRVENEELKADLRSAEADVGYLENECDELENRNNDRIDELEWALELEAKRLTQAWRRITELQQQRARS